MSEPFRLPGTSRSLGGVLASGFALYRDSFAVTAPLAVVTQLVAALPQVAHLLSRRELDTGRLPSATGTLVTGVFMTISLLPWLAMTLRCWAWTQGEIQPLEDSLRRALALLPRALVASIVYLLVTFIGLLLLVVPGLYLGVALLLYPLPLLVENSGALASLARSRALMRGHWWRASLVISVPLTLAALVALLQQLLPLLRLLGVVPGEGSAPVLDFAVTAGAFLLNALITPLTVAMMIALYHDLRLAHGEAVPR